MKYFISAGEASGDIHAAGLIEKLREHDPEATFTFLGGDLMAEAAGAEPEVHYRDMAYMGFAEVIRHLPGLLSILSRARKIIRSERPDAVILVDYPSFNLKLAREAASLGIPVYYYISPKVWAWKERRLKAIRRYVDRVLSILPFEVEYFRSHGMEVDYVGNPSREEVDRRLASLEPRSEFILRHELTQRPILALVPGSREGEIRNNLPVMVAVAKRHRELQAVVAGAPGIDISLYRRYTTFPVVSHATFDLMAHADAALVTSGTATLECALTGTPQIAMYRANGSRLSYELFRRILKIPFVTLPNLISGREIIPEMLLHNCTPDKVDRHLRGLLPGEPRRETMIKDYGFMRTRLGNQEAADTAAKIIIQSLHQQK